MTVFSDGVVAIAITSPVSPLVELVPQTVARHGPSVTLIAAYTRQSVNFAVNDRFSSPHWLTSRPLRQMGVLSLLAVQVGRDRHAHGDRRARGILPATVAVFGGLVLLLIVPALSCGVLLLKLVPPLLECVILLRAARSRATGADEADEMDVR